MSAMLAALSAPREGAPLIFTLSECARLFARMQLAPPPVDEVDAQPLGACLFVIGRCLLGMSEQLQLCVSDPGGHSFRDWVVASCASLPENVVVPESRKLLAGVEELVGALQSVQQVLRPLAGLLRTAC